MKPIKHVFGMSSSQFRRRIEVPAAGLMSSHNSHREVWGVHWVWSWPESAEEAVLCFVAEKLGLAPAPWHWDQAESWLSSSRLRWQQQINILKVRVCRDNSFHLIWFIVLIHLQWKRTQKMRLRHCVRISIHIFWDVWDSLIHLWNMFVEWSCDIKPEIILNDFLC